ncbi:MAG: sigma-54 dependent transcriptional regulator [Desulfobacteraceae bacterium]|jgi:two-component system NtrC family response regulator
MAEILVIDDDIDVCMMIKSAANSGGHMVDYALTIKDGCHKAFSCSYSLIFLDVNLPDGNALYYLTKLKESPSYPEIVIITGEGDPDGAETAIKHGVWDYVKKPFSDEIIKLQLECVMQYREEKKSPKTISVLKREGIIGESPQILSSLELVADASLSDINVLITGETGTGKECFAKAIHNNSMRSKGNFVIVDCAVLPETLVESTLFGHVKGAFTGSDRDHEGLVKQADGGTLFLDEIGELPFSVQKAFLRVLQERSFRPVGGKKVFKSDFRLITATNRDLGRMVEEGTFREDLFFRIKSMMISLPPLREHSMDIQELAMYYVSNICEYQGITIKNISSQFINTLEKYDWPGNIRELVNILEWSIIKARFEPTLYPKHLPEQTRISVACSSMPNFSPKSRNNTCSDNKISSYHLPKYKEFRKRAIFDKEKDYLNELISRSNGNIDKACDASGLGRTRLYDLMKNHGISRSY